ncbi:MAG: beta-ketoacyl-ACP synthase II [Anaerolineae bacterium]
MSKDPAKRRVVVTGMGTINPLANTKDETWIKIQQGLSGLAPITRFDTTDHKTTFGAEVKDFDAEGRFGRRDARRTDPSIQYAWAAAEEALADCDFDSIAPEIRRRAGVILGVGLGGFTTVEENVNTLNNRGPSRVSPHFIPMMLPDSVPARVSLQFGLCGPNMSIATACASSTNAIGEAANMVKFSGYDVMVTGGSESTMTPTILAGFNNMGALSTWNHDPLSACRPFSENRNGFVMGEGAAVLVLEELEHALARGVHIYGEIAGYGTSSDAFHVTAPQEDGLGAVESMQLALDRAGMSPADVDYINAHGTSTKLNDAMETKAIKHLFKEAAYDVAISSTKANHGHLLGATGALELMISLLAMENSFAPPTLNYDSPDPELDLDFTGNTPKQMEINSIMSNSFGFGGHNATLIGRKVNSA